MRSYLTLSSEALKQLLYTLNDFVLLCYLWKKKEKKVDGLL